MTHPESWIIELDEDAGRYSVDPNEWGVRTLEDGWDRSNTDDREPHVSSMEDEKSITFRNQDYIIVYLTSPTEDPKFSPYTHKSIMHMLSFDFFVHGDRAHAIRVFEEAGRVMNEKRFDTYEAPGDDAVLTGRTWMNWAARSTPMQQISKGHYRRTIEAEINWRFREIKT